VDWFNQMKKCKGKFFECQTTLILDFLVFCRIWNGASFCMIFSNCEPPNKCFNFLSKADRPKQLTGTKASSKEFSFPRRFPTPRSAATAGATTSGASASSHQEHVDEHHSQARRGRQDQSSTKAAGLCTLFSFVLTDILHALWYLQIGERLIKTFLSSTLLFLLLRIDFRPLVQCHRALFLPWELVPKCFRA